MPAPDEIRSVEQTTAKAIGESEGEWAALRRSADILREAIGSLQLA